MSTKKKIISVAFVFFFKAVVFSQYIFFDDRNIAFTIGANMAFGTHFQRLGLNINFAYATSHLQLNSEIRAYYSFKNLGPKFIYPELVLSQGVLYSFGKKLIYKDLCFNSISNHTDYKYAVAYAYNAYFNNKRTSQQTGILALRFGEVALITENDILARPYLDRFRTAAFLLQYQYRQIFQAAINCTMWTGQLKRKAQNERTEFYNGCYMDTTGARYANYSHGLLSLQFKYGGPYGQVLQANAGADAEQVRNVMQNKFIHDMRFLSKKWQKTKNCHIPMLDQNENQFLYREDQKIRKPKLYFNLFSNGSVFY